MQECKKVEITVAPFHLQPRWAACPGPPFQAKLFCTPGFTGWGSCAVSCEIRITHSTQLQSALYPALLRNLEGSMSNQSCQCKLDGLVQIKLLQPWFGFFFPLSWARKKLVLLFCVTSCMFYLFCRKHLCGMKDVKLLAPKNVTSSVWIMTQPHLDIWLQGWTCYNTVQKWEIKPGQQEAWPGWGSDLQLPSAGGNGPNPLHSTPNALLLSYDNSLSLGVPQRPGLTVREMMSNGTLSLKIKHTGYSK